MTEKNYLWSGPTLVLLALGLVAFIGFAVIGVEGGRIYFQQQLIQSIANDTAAGMCFVDNNPTNRGQEAIPKNNHNYISTITVNNPPESGPHAGNINYIEVIVSRLMDGGLLEAAYSEGVFVTGKAVILCDAEKTGIAGK